MNLTVNLYLSKSTKETYSILCYVRSGNNVTSFNTGEKIELKYWDKGKQKAKKSYKYANELNQYLTIFIARIEEHIREYRIKNQNFTFDDIKLYIRACLTGTITELYTLYDQFTNLKKKRNAYSTISRLVTLKKYMHEFEVHNHINLQIENIDKVTLADFTDFLIDKQFTNEYINKLVLNLKLFLSWCFDNEFTTNDKWRNSKPLPMPAPKKMTLTLEEVQAITTVDLSISPELNKTRDLFLFQLYTGQRFSDIQAFNIFDVQDNIWTIIQQKTKTKISVALIDKALEILKKYNYKLPKISNQRMNYNLKAIGMKAGLQGYFSEIRLSGAKQFETRYQRYELLCTHTARRTAITLLSEHNVNTSLIKSISGHSSDAMVHRYFHPNNVNAQRNAISAIYE